MRHALRTVALVATSALAAATSSSAAAQERPETPPWTEPVPPPRDPRLPWKPKVQIPWNRWYHVPELHQSMRDLAAAFPDLVELRSIGKSVEGRDLLLCVLTDRTTGADTAKPAMWCDGNIHGNEVQAAETCLYMIWWLCENRDRAPRIRQLLAERTFYVLPSLNPDGRARWFDEPNTMHSSRGGSRKVDNDRDGRFDEDAPDDLDGDGELLEMRIESADGEWKEDPLEPRLMVRVQPGERGRWKLIGIEGKDDDGDGRFNEDGPGGYDPNRDWPSDWRHPAEQNGAGPYPASLPETRAVISFLTSHPNIAGFQSFHNAGGMILRGPGAKTFNGNGAYAERDDRVLRALAARGEQQLPFYRSLLLWKDLYQVYGGEVNFAYEGLGIFAFTNELWTPDQYRGRKIDDSGRERLRFDDDLELGMRYAAWKPFVHPQLGKVELGGWRKDTGRVPPTFMTEELLHRNAMFVVFHASQMPNVAAGGVAVRPIGGGLFEVDATFRNEGSIPTRSSRAAEKKIGAPDVIALEGAGLTVVSSGVVAAATNRVATPQFERPAQFRLPEGIDGDGAVTVRFVVRGTGAATVTCRAEKGGVVSQTADVK